VAAAALGLTVAWSQTVSTSAVAVRRAIAKLVVPTVQWGVDDGHGATVNLPLAMALPGQTSSSPRRQDARTMHFQGLMVPHLDAAYNLARFLSRDADAAQDIVQDAYLRAFKAFDGYRGGEPRAWILAIVRNCYRAWAGQRGRDRNSRAETAPEDDLRWGLGGVNWEDIADTERETPEGELARKSNVEAVRRIIETLPEVFREVLVLRELEELGYRQIADIVEVPIGTVMSRLARARRLFGAAWVRHCGETEATK
jgi:RNA polymerase sigma-70 factor, ECF subfamily